jgi:acyl-coenzyme A synthetase/AMP-(fatty) acid ligase
LRYRDQRPAIIESGEVKKEESISFSQLWKTVGQYRAALIERGVKKGDRVVAVIPNCIYAV